MTMEFDQETIDLSGVSVAGSTTIVGDEATSLAAKTAIATTTFTLVSGSASLNGIIPAGAFSTNVPFTVQRLSDALEPQDGLDPLVAYHFDFDVPTLGSEASLTFTVDVDGLSTADRQALLDAIAAGRATLAVKGDATGAAYAPFAICSTGEAPTADGCVSVTVDGSLVTFTGIAGHFSTWAVVTVDAPVVVDETPPVVVVPTDMTVEAVGPDGASVDFSTEVSASDDVDGTVDVSCEPQPGSTFPLGTASVTCLARDTAGNLGSASFTVTVVDTTTPLVVVPGDTTVPATGPTGAVATFTASASDLVDGTVAPACDPASGSTFAIGTTTVTCRATDAAGNVGSATFKVTVAGAADQLTALRNDVAAAAPPLTPKLSADLTGKLNDALSKLTQGKTADACTKIKAFIDKVGVEAKRGTIPASLAADWLERAHRIRTVLGC